MNVLFSFMYVCLSHPWYQRSEEGVTAPRTGVWLSRHVVLGLNWSPLEEQPVLSTTAVSLQPHSWVLVLFCLFWDRVSTRFWLSWDYIDHCGFKRTEISLPLPPKCWDLSHAPPHPRIFFFLRIWQVFELIWCYHKIHCQIFVCCKTSFSLGHILTWAFGRLENCTALHHCPWVS